MSKKDNIKTKEQVTVTSSSEDRKLSDKKCWHQQSMETLVGEWSIY